MELHTLNPHDVEYFTEITNSEYFKRKSYSGTAGQHIYHRPY